MVRRRKEVKPPRRKKGTGSIYQRNSDGRWVYETPPVDGIKYTGYAETREEATRALDAELVKIKAGTFVAPDRITVAQWLTEWFENIKSASCRMNTQYNWKSVIHTRLIPAIGKIPVQRLTSRELVALVAKWVKEGLAPATIHHYFCPLSISLESAVKHGIIRENPCKAVELPQIKKRKQPALSMDQVQLLLIEVNEHWLLPWIIIVVGTGMRVNEVAALKWGDIDFDARVIHVRRNVSHVEGFKEGPPKTEAGIRDIAMPEFVEEELERLRGAQLLKKGEYGLGWNKDGLVLPRDDGKYRRSDVVNHAFQAKLKQAGLPTIPFYCLRHSAARIMRCLGIQLDVIQRVLGHASLKVTADVYSDIDIDIQQDSMVTYNDAFKRAKKRAN